MSKKPKKYLLDEPIPSFTASVLEPTKYQVPQTETVFKKVKSSINTFADWILNYICEKIKKPVNEKLEALKTQVCNLCNKFGVRRPIKFKLTASALRNITKQYSVDGIAGYDPIKFLEAVKSEAIKILKDNRQTKVSFVLTCEMEKVDIKSGEITTSDPKFAKQK